MAANEIVDKLGLHKLNQSWYVQLACANSGAGLYEGLDWLAKILTQQNKDKDYSSR